MERLYAHVGSRNAALQQRPEVLKAIGMYAAIHVLSRMVNNLMRVVGCQSFIRQQSVSIKSCASFDVLAYFPLQCALAAIRYYDGAKFSAALHDPHDCGFILSASSCNPALPFAQLYVSRLSADKSLIYFDFAAVAAQLASEEFILQGQTDAMQHEPSGFLGHSQIAGNFVAT